MLTDWDIIERAGAELGASPEAMRKWRVRGVSRFFRLEIVKIAQRDGFDFDDSAFDAPPGSKRQNSGEKAINGASDH